MIQTICDHCDEVCENNKIIILSGFVGASGGILLPACYQTKHFCGPKCFAEWIVNTAKIQDVLQGVA
jgi:hypothetical protein